MKRVFVLTTNQDGSIFIFSTQRAFKNFIRTWWHTLADHGYLKDMIQEMKEEPGLTHSLQYDGETLTYSLQDVMR